MTTNAVLIVICVLSMLTLVLQAVRIAKLKISIDLQRFEMQEQSIALQTRISALEVDNAKATEFGRDLIGARDATTARAMLGLLLSADLPRRRIERP